MITENVKKIANYDTLLQSYQKLIQTKNEPKAENNGIYTWDGEILTKSDFSRLDDFLINEGDNWSTL